MGWTKEQETAIDKYGENKGKDILVSAGAGSGKTAVLSERVLEYVKRGGDVKKLLILTFTKAAAKEMADRIRKNLKEAGLKDASKDVELSYITTFDAYSLGVVKKYYYKLGISKDVSILNSTIETLKKEEILEDIFMEYYKNKNPRFLNIIQKYSKQDDKNIKQMVNNIYNVLELTINVDDFCNTYESKYYSDDKILKIQEAYINLIIEKKDAIIKRIDTCLNELNGIIEGEPLVEYLVDFKNKIEQEEDYKTLKEIFLNFDYNNIKNIKTGKPLTFGEKKIGEKAADIKDDIKKIIGKIKELFDYNSLDEVGGAVLSSKEDILFILNMAKMLYDRLYEYKMANMSFSYSDIARMSIKLVTDNKEVCDEIKDYFNEILVDEYQDTSDIQEAFLSKIKNNNLYMVGDIKQSIYRFRNANPDIFKDKYNLFSVPNSQDGLKINLTKNFRSRQEVVDDINACFGKIMTLDCGDADYSKSHIMEFGQTDYNETPAQNIDYKAEVLAYDKDPSKYADYTKGEVEAFIIADKIKEIKESNIKVLKGKKNDENGKKVPNFVDVSYGDFAILISTSSEFMTFKKVFDYKKIPFQIIGDLELKESVLSNIFANILGLIVKIKEKDFKTEYKHLKASIARSFLYSYSEEEIFEMIVENKHKSIDDDFEYFAQMADVSYENLYFSIVEKLNVYEKLALIGNVDASVVEMKSICDLFMAFNDLSLTISEAAKYLKDAFANDNIKIPYTVPAPEGECVRILTIHKSKGLEYPFVFLPMLNKKFNDADVRAKEGFNKDFGIYIKTFSDINEDDSDEDNTEEQNDGKGPIKAISEAAEKKALVSEKMRLLYVAYTRAREKLFLVCESKLYRGVKEKPEKDIIDNNYNSFRDMLKIAEVLSGNQVKNVDLESLGLTLDYKKNIKKEIPSGNLELKYENFEKLKPIEHTHASGEIFSIPDKKTRENLKLGTDFHEALEALDLKNPDIDNLPTTEFIKSKLKEILSNDIFKNIKNGKNYHEYEFYANIDDKDVHGIIDLFIVYDDHIDIIDYKLSHTNKDIYVKQLNTYKDYLSTIYNLPINIYLLSILKNEITKLD